MRHEFDGFTLVTNDDRGYGAAHTIFTYENPEKKWGFHAINVGVARNEYQRSVSPDGTEHEVLNLLNSTSPEVVRHFLLRKGGDSACGLYDLYSFEEFKEALKKEEEHV